LQPPRQGFVDRNTRFFYLSMSHETLANMLETNFQMMQNYHYALHELENMTPWERRVYVGMLIQWIKEENERNEEYEGKMNSYRR